MKKLLSAAALFCCLLATGAFCQTLTVETDMGKPVGLSRADLEALPRVKVTTGSADQTALFEGASLKNVLEKAGVTFGESLKGRRLGSCVLVEATDHYRVVIALPELDPAFTDKQVLLAFLKNGKSLDDKEGPYRLVIPDEKQMARWVRQVTSIRIVNVQ